MLKQKYRSTVVPNRLVNSSTCRNTILQTEFDSSYTMGKTHYPRCQLSRWLLSWYRFASMLPEISRLALPMCWSSSFGPSTQTIFLWTFVPFPYLYCSLQLVLFMEFSYKCALRGLVQQCSTLLYQTTHFLLKLWYNAFSDFKRSTHDTEYLVVFTHAVKICEYLK